MYHDCKRAGVIMVWFSLEVEDSQFCFVFLPKLHGLRDLSTPTRD